MNYSTVLAKLTDPTHFHGKMSKYQFSLRYLLIENIFVNCAVRPIQHCLDFECDLFDVNEML